MRFTYGDLIPAGEAHAEPVARHVLDRGMALADEAQLVGHDDKDAMKRRPSVCQLNAPAAQVPRTIAAELAPRVVSASRVSATDALNAAVVRSMYPIETRRRPVRPWSCRCLAPRC